MKKGIILAVLICIFFALNSCSFGKNDVKFTKESYPRVDGSTATIPLSEAVAAKLLSLSEEDMKQFVRHNKTHRAYVNLIEGNADIIFVTEPSDDELELAKKAGVELEVVPVVKEAFVFLINKKNPVDAITVKQIQDIYTGRIKNWKELGGADADIIAYQRPDNSGSQTIMTNVVMKGLNIMDAPKALKPAEMGGLIEAVAAYDNSERAIGYSVYYFANSMYNRETIKFVKVDGIEPDNETIKTDKYPYTSAYYAVLKKTEPEDSKARKLLNWILSDQGQKVAEEAGYVPVR